MKSARDRRRNDARDDLRPAQARSVGAGGEKWPPKDENGDDVLPNLLLDVREGFLGAFRSVFRQFGVTDQQFRVLSILHIVGDLEIGKLARRARIVAPSMTGILDRMEEIGWVARKTQKGQRWGVVSLTGAGRKLIKQLQPKVNERAAVFETAMGAEKLALLAGELTHARAVLRELSGGVDEPQTSGTRTGRKSSGRPKKSPGVRSKSRKPGT